MNMKILVLLACVGHSGLGLDSITTGKKDSGVETNIKTRVANLKKELDLSNDRANKAEAGLREKDLAVDRLENDLKAAHQKLSLTEEELDKAETSIGELTTRAIGAETGEENSHRTVIMLEENAYALEEELETLEEANEKLEEKYADAEQKLQNSDLKNGLKDLETQIEGLETQNEDLAVQNEDLKKKNEEADRMIMMLEEDLARAIRDLAEQKLQNSDLKNGLKDLETQIEGLETQNEDLAVQNEDLEKKNEEADRMIMMLEEDLARAIRDLAKC